MKKAVFISTAIFFLGITLALFSCEKEGNNTIDQVTTSELSTTDQAGPSPTAQGGVEDRSSVCSCVEAGCNDPQSLTLTVLGKVGTASVNLSVRRSCSTPSTPYCFGITGATVGSNVSNAISYQVGAVPVGTQPVTYLLGALFTQPVVGKNSITVRVDGPGIVNNVYTFYPSTPNVSLYPNMPACY